MNNQIYEGTAQYNLIYVFAIHDDAHKGYLKIGQTSFNSSSSYKQLLPNCDELNANARLRINQYTRTALVPYELLYTELARTQRRLRDGTIEAVTFSDHDVHQVLDRSGYDVHKFIDTDRDSEWYKVGLDAAIAAISAAKEGRTALSPSEKLGKTSTIDGSSVKAAMPSIILREEQMACIEKTLKVFANSDRMLWDCKMRFGKTVTAYSLVKKVGYKKVIVVTHRPAVVDGWSSDFNLIFNDDDRVFVTKSNMMYEDRFTAEDAGIDADNDRQLRNLANSGKSFVYFASMQDLRGSKIVGGKYEKNRAVFDMDWDIIIYDEAHEGTQTELGIEVQKKLEETKQGKTPKKVLQLSGTPYNLLNQYEDDNVYSWDYVMEQRCKKEWDTKHPGDHNPYAELPELRICTFDLRKKIATSYRYEDETVAFNFREFFRTWTGDPSKDFMPLPHGKSIGDFVHEDDVETFLDLITTDSPDTNYPFATPEYREMFKHTFWILPGVKEARAFSALLKRHDVFRSYEIVNVAGDGDVEQPYDDALKAVKEAIAKNDKTITISCGKLTTGVTVKQWNGVMLLSGSSSTGAAGYMQTVFRVQSAGCIDGKQKTVCYAFDFAPDRALRVLSDVHKLKKSAVGTDDAGRVQLGEFLNFCPVLAEGDTGMEYYDVPKMMRQLKRITVDAAVKSGFDDDSIYKADAGIVMDSQKAKLFDQLKMKLNPQKKGKKETHVKVADNGLTQEEYRKAQEAKRKSKKNRTKEEEEALQKEKEQKKKQQALFDLLRNVSIRLPLLIYGTATEFDESINLEDFITLVDAESWKEFMPKEVDKELFRKLLVFYDEDVIAGAGMRIRKLAKAADELPPTQRVKRIAEIFSYFRNPAKETVLTPWRVVNMHMGDTVGGYNFYKEGYPLNDGVLEEPRLIDQGQVTEDLFLNENAKVLEMNSKSGLYPLYVAYSIYRILLPKSETEMTLEEAQVVWDKVLTNHLYVLCQTTMAVSITKRTLAGYRKADVKAIYLTKLLDRMQDKKRLSNKLTNPTTWGEEGEKMKFDAIVGNPPYQVMDGGSGTGISALPVYDLFVEQSKAISPHYITMITPSRWFAGGKGLDDFRSEMLADKHLVKIIDYMSSKDCFPGVNIAGGINYFLWDNKYDGECEIVNSSAGKIVSSALRSLDEFDVFIRDNLAISIIRKFIDSGDSSLANNTYSRNPFGFVSKDRGTSNPNDVEDCITLISSAGEGYVARSSVQKNIELIDKFKVTIGKVVPNNGEVDTNPKDGYKVTTKSRILKPKEIHTESYLLLHAFDTEGEARNFANYMSLKFPRFMMKHTLSSMNISTQNFVFVPFLDFKRTWTDEELFKRYGLTEEEKVYVESIIRPME